MRTTDAARAKDLMRQVLGDEKLHYFGISTTELGGVTPTCFPSTWDVPLDAVVDPTQTSEQSSLGQAKSFQLALDNFAQDCVSKTEDCPVGDTAADVKAASPGC
ncbi:Alpha/beta hydrolase OS=Streptomyces tendae OX=1932 GN=GUR47_14950 PE=3 SV=1 [Streptomyces tendae]